MPTAAAGIGFLDAASLTTIVKFIMSGNSIAGGVAAAFSGITTGRWLLTDGLPSLWTGFGSPETFVTAPVGSQYMRLDGGAGTTLYVKEANVTAVGWVAK